MTEEQINEVMRLASLWATARCRKVLTIAGKGNPNETLENTSERTLKACDELQKYLEKL